MWRYELRRDDPTPPPWTEEGQKRIEELGLEMVVRINNTINYSGQSNKNDANLCEFCRVRNFDKF